MSRIRSVHPGLFTDEAFAFLSDAAQVLLIGLWTECDDQGAFEWKPGMLRMRLRPGKDGAIEPLLTELEQANCIMSYEHGGRKLGLVRNFQKFQRPKKPNAVHFVPSEYRTYLGSASASSELTPSSDPPSSELEGVQAPSVPQKGEPTPLEPASVPQKGEKSPQMEDGGDNRRREKKDISASSSAPARADAEELEQKLREAAGWQSDPSPNLFVTGPIHGAIAGGADLELDVLPVVRSLAPRCRGRKNWNFFVPAIIEARDGRIAAATAPVTTKRSASLRPTNGTHRQKPSRDETFAAIDRRIDDLERSQADDRSVEGWQGDDEPVDEGPA